MVAFAAGFALGFSLILAIGAQNAFVLRQGLLGQHVLAVCLACVISDGLLIAAGVAGFAAVSEAYPQIIPLMRWGGAAFLAVYGALSFRNALRASGALEPAERQQTSRARALAICLSLTWLNPHVYLDTVVLLGSVSTQYEGHQTLFGAGAILASTLFFFGLGYGARLLRPFFARPAAWRVLEVVVGVTMWAIALKLVLD